METRVLRILLLLAGIGIIALGLNVGLGGIQTLGWQGSTDFITVSNAEQFAVQDNHIRFIAGVWAGVGLVFVLGAIKPRYFARTLVFLCLLIALGGLFRLSAGDFALVTGFAILPSLIAELVLFPALAVWIHRTFVHDTHR